MEEGNKVFNIKVLETELSVLLIKPSHIKKLNPFYTSTFITLNSSFYSITKTANEVSIVCEKDILQNNPVNCEYQIEDDWKAIKIVGSLDFSLTGVLSKFLAPLAENKISIFSISTYETDYILVKEDSLRKAIEVLEHENVAKVV